MQGCLALFPGSSLAFCCMLYKKRGESLGDLITCAWHTLHGFMHGLGILITQQTT